MNSTALTTLTTNGDQLTEQEAMILAEMQDDAAAFDLQPARVRIAPGGVGQFVMGDEMVKSFTAIVAISQKIRGYWPDQGTGSPPLCSSPDGNRGYFDPDLSDTQFEAASGTSAPHPGIVLLSNKETLPESFACHRCPMSAWGSEHQRRGGNGKGKACKEMRRLLLLIDGWTLPALMSLPPTSIRAWDSYCSSLAARKGAYFAVKTKFSLDSAKANSGETYNVVQVSVTGKIDELDQLRMVSEIRRQYRELVSGLPVDAAEYDTRPAPGGPDGEDAEEIPF